MKVQTLLLLSLVAACLADDAMLPVEEAVEESEAVPVSAPVATKGDTSSLAGLYRDYYRRRLMTYMAARYAYAPASKGYTPLAMAMASKGAPLSMAMASKGSPLSLAMASKGAPLSMAMASKGYYYPSYAYMSAYYRNKMVRDMMEARAAAAEAANVKGAQEEDGLQREAPPPVSGGGSSKGDGSKGTHFLPPGTCQMPKDSGSCFGDPSLPAGTRYHFNQFTGRCDQFIYGGCAGNPNNFETMRDCQSQCACDLAPSPGPCYAFTTRFFFNKATQSCEKFVYGGCGGNANNYATLNECKNACGCKLPAKKGVCRAQMARWYHNPESGGCDVFIYGGCGANANNFMSKDECEKTC